MAKKSKIDFSKRNKKSKYACYHAAKEIILGYKINQSLCH